MGVFYFIIFFHSQVVVVRSSALALNLTGNIKNFIEYNLNFHTLLYSTVHYLFRTQYYFIYCSISLLFVIGVKHLPESHAQNVRYIYVWNIVSRIFKYAVPLG